MFFQVLSRFSRYIVLWFFGQLYNLIKTQLQIILCVYTVMIKYKKLSLFTIDKIIARQIKNYRNENK